MEGFKLHEGRGLLSARALFATVVGPQRLAMTEQTVKELKVDQPTLLFSNIGAADVYVFLGVSLPAGAPVASLRTLLSRGDSIGSATTAPFVLVQQMNTGNVGGFMQLLQPDEQLYAQIDDTAFVPGDTQNVIVAAVTF